MNATPLLEVEGLGHGFGRSPQRTEVLGGLDLALSAGEIFGLVGESGAGKTTFARCVLGLQAPDRGRVLVLGEDVYATGAGYHDRRLRRRVQAVFQDPLAALNPRHRVRRVLHEPLAWHDLGTAAERDERIAATLAELQLDPALAERYPSQLSGGQRQRVCLARALVLEPDLVVLDEPVTALDVSVQALVLDLLRRHRERHGTAFLLISHDLAVVQQVADRVGVLHDGRLVETGPVDAVFSKPATDYTERLLAAVPGSGPPADG